MKIDLEPTLTRRRLLGLIASTVCLPVMAETAAAAALRGGKKLVLVELAGANDGLNTLVPHSDDRYLELRPSIGLRKNDLVSLDSEFSLNNACTDVMPLWDDGELAVVHGLGYPRPNRSHFKSIAIWETGGDGARSGRSGWLTHAIEHAYASKAVDAHGISLGGGMNIFSSKSGNWLSLKSSRQLMKPVNFSSEQGDKPASEALELVMQRTALLENSLTRFRSKLKASKFRSNIRGGQLAQQLKHVANLIHAGVDAPVYKVSLGSFDTHENQPGRHRQLLRELSLSMAGFREELKSTGEWENTVVMTYSEFGRRARENQSGGTDHGTAAPHLVTGGGINGGFYGNAPDLGDLESDDLKFTMDYRSLYSAILDDWLKTGENRFAEYGDDRLKNLVLHA